MPTHASSEGIFAAGGQNYRRHPNICCVCSLCQASECCFSVDQVLYLAKLGRLRPVNWLLLAGYSLVLCPSLTSYPPGSASESWVYPAGCNKNRKNSYCRNYRRHPNFCCVCSLCQASECCFSVDQVLYLAKLGRLRPVNWLLLAGYSLVLCPSLTSYPPGSASESWVYPAGCNKNRKMLWPAWNDATTQFPCSLDEYAYASESTEEIGLVGQKICSA